MSTFTGGDGDDTFAGGGAADTLVGADGSDTLYGGANNDVLYGDNPSFFNSAAGNDALFGGAGYDFLSGGLGVDTLYGGAGDDTLVGFTAYGAAAHTADGVTTYSFNYSGQSTASAIDGGDGRDTAFLLYDFSNDAVSLDNKSDTATNVILRGGAAFGSLTSVETIQITLGAGADTIHGGSGGDSLFGGGGANQLFGGDGDDSLTGGTGNDLFDGGSGNDTVGFYDSFQGVTIDLNAQGAGQATGDGQDTLTSIENLIGSQGSDVLTGDGGANKLDAGVSGDDQLFGGGGDDLLTATRFIGGTSTSTNVSLFGGEGADTLSFQATAYRGALDLITLDGGSGDDAITSTGAAASVVFGGAGHDRVVVDAVAGAFTVTLGADADTLSLAGTGGVFHTGSADVVTDFQTGDAGDVLDLSDWLAGGALTDYAAGSNPFADGHLRLLQSGADTLLQVDRDGGGDSYATLLTLQHATASAFTAANLHGYDPDPALTLRAGASAATLDGGDKSDVLIGGSGDDLLRGHDGADSLYGGTGNDTLDGGTGADQLQGGAGDDTYVVDSTADQPFEKAGEGTDTIQTTLNSYTLGSNLENLTFVGAGSFTGTGDALANVITGGDGNDVLDGGRGADTVYGGAGNDTITVDNGGDWVFGGYGGADRVIVYNSDFHLNADSSVEIMVAGGAQGIALYGLAGNEHLIGNAAANVIYGGGGKDALDGMGGDDTLHVTLANRDSVTIDGGAGSDTLVLDTLDTSVAQILVVDGMTASGYSGAMGDGYNGVGFTDVDRFDVTAGALNDSLDFTPVATRVVADAGAGDDRVLGGSAGDSLTGGAGDDTLDGRGGADTLIGNAGDDAYYVDSAGDRVVEQVNAGHDEVIATLSTYVLPQNVEDLVYNGSGTFLGRGNALNNTINADLATVATLHGGGGDDVLVGSQGDNSLYGEAGRDSVYGGDGNDYIRTLTGEGSDTIDGGDGTDLLTMERSTDAGAFNIDLTRTGEQMTVGDGGSIMHIEQIRFAGGLGADSIVGGGLDDVLKGGGGNDTLSAGGGNDIVEGGAGRNLVTGGTGADIFRFDSPTLGNDTLSDFETGIDHVALSKASFEIASLADFDIVDASTGPTEAKATLIVDTVNHTLSWDADGTGSASATLFAHGAFTTSAADYLVF